MASSASSKKEIVFSRCTKRLTWDRRSSESKTLHRPHHSIRLVWDPIPHRAGSGCWAKYPRRMQGETHRKFKHGAELTERRRGTVANISWGSRHATVENKHGDFRTTCVRRSGKMANLVSLVIVPRHHTQALWGGCTRDVSEDNSRHGEDTGVPRAFIMPLATLSRLGVVQANTFHAQQQIPSAAATLTLFDHTPWPSGEIGLGGGTSSTDSDPRSPPSGDASSRSRDIFPLPSSCA